MFEDIDSKNVGEVKEGLKRIVKETMEEIDTSFTTIVEKTKETLDKNMPDIKKMIQDLTDTLTDSKIKSLQKFKNAGYEQEGPDLTKGIFETIIEKVIEASIKKK